MAKKLVADTLRVQTSNLNLEKDNEESLIVVYIYSLLLIVGIFSNAIVLLVTFTDQLRKVSF